MKKILIVVIMLFTLLIYSCGLADINQEFLIEFITQGGTEIASQKVKYGNKVVKPEDPVRGEDEFLYWRYTHEEYDFSKPVYSNMVLRAVWNVVEHIKTTTVVEPTCTEKGYTLTVCTCGEETKSDFIDALGHIEILHEGKLPTETEIGWEEYITCDRCDYTTYKEIPATGIYLDLVVYEENGKLYVDFGLYPQTHINDVELINNLNQISKYDSNGYYEYDGNLYAKVYAQPVNHSSSSYIYSDNEAVTYGVIEWFKVEPIKWRVLSSKDNKYELVSEYLLDTSYYCYTDLIRTFNDTEVYPNNYLHSDIREFLNNTFLNKAFDEYSRLGIVTKNVDNGVTSADSKNNKYLCDNTLDKVYLLSYQDLINSEYGFGVSSSAKDEAKEAKVTDYAKAVGVWWRITSSYEDNGYWWLRTPDDNYSTYAHTVTGKGILNDPSIVTVPEGGVRPAITVRVK